MQEDEGGNSRGEDWSGRTTTPPSMPPMYRRTTWSDIFDGQWLGVRIATGFLRPRPCLVRREIRLRPGLHLNAGGPRTDPGGGDITTTATTRLGRLHRQHHRTMGVEQRLYGRDPAVNGLLSSFWSHLEPGSPTTVAPALLYRVTSEEHIRPQL